MEAGLSCQQISDSTKTSIGAIQKRPNKADSFNLQWPFAAELDGELAQLFYPQANLSSGTTCVVD